MADFIIAIILLVIVGGAAAYIYKAKKSGRKCIGCPDGGTCGKNNNSSDGCGCGCGCSSEE